MKTTKMLVAGALLILPLMANAADGQGGPKGDKGDKGGFMMQLTDEQKACLDAQNCPKPDMQKGDKKEMTAEDKAAMQAARDCRKKAFETCGIQVPDHGAKGSDNGQQVKARAAKRQK